MSNMKFDVQSFYAALDATRISRGLTWKAVAKETGVAASTLTRIGQGKRPDVDGLSALLHWAGLRVETFYTDKGSKRGNPESLAQISALLRADKSLSDGTVRMLEEMLKAAYGSSKISKK